MDHTAKNIVLNDFVLKMYESKARDRFSNLEHFHLSKKTSSFSGIPYILIFSVNINGDCVFTEPIYRSSPESCLEAGFIDMDKAVNKFERLVKNEQFDRVFLTTQGLAKKAFVDDGLEPYFIETFSKKLRKSVRKTKNNLNTFRHIMNSIK